MIRKGLFTLALSLVTLISVAQIGAGQWKMHPFFNGGNTVNCVDAGSRVYFLSNGSLFYFDKASQTHHVMDFLGDLNDEVVNQLYYNPEKGSLFIAYNDCNIDIVDNQGIVHNVSAIKDVILPKQKVINDITFSGNKTYISTSFGYILLDGDEYRVSEVRNYDYNVPSVAVVGNYKIMSMANRFYYCEANEQVEEARFHKQVDCSVGVGQILPINDSRFFLTTKSALYIVTISENGDESLSFTLSEIIAKVPSVLQKTSTGFVASFPADNIYCTFDANGDNFTQNSSNEIYTSQEPGNWWVLGPNGLAHIVNGVKGEYVSPNAISISTRAYWSTFDPYQNRVLLCRTAENRVLEEWIKGTTEINSWDGSQWHDVTPRGVDSDNDGNFWIVVSPNEPNTYYYCCRKIGGVTKVQNDSIVARYNNSNSPVSDRAAAIAFDSKGNLWIAQPYPDKSPTPDALAITPEKQALDSVNISDFVINDMGGACKNAKKGFKRMAFDIGADDIKVYSAGNYNDPLVVWRNNEDLSLKEYKVFESFNDQDNKYYTTYGWVYIKADNEGIMWIGTVSGVVSFDPREAFNSNFRINRVKVSKNEGAMVNEVLLEGTQVNCIGCDNLNRKWIGTNTNGLYLVSADGSEIIKHFEMNNSPLPSNQIYSVCCNRATNSVLVVTANGVLEFYHDLTPSAGDYSNVYAYPNPVQSTFTGYVTINGLMDNSHVVITDAAGQVVASTTSIGGVAVWDACKSNGVPVNTGVYKVYAAQGTNPSTTGKPVTKIAVIK